MADTTPDKTPDKTPDPTPGRIVQYTLTQADVDRIESDRIASLGYGNKPHAGDVVPVIVTRAWPERRVNGQAVLDGNDRLWIASADEGDDAGQWHYPARA